MESIIKQILLHLYNCVDYGFAYRTKKGLWISDYFDHQKREIVAKQIKEAVVSLNKQKLIKKKEDYNGKILITLTEKGRMRALNLSFRAFYNRKEKWDRKWRMVAFDIPDEYKKGRDALRYRLRLGGFYELQESLFLYPHDCRKEINDFTKLFKLEKYIRFALVDFIDNEKEIKIKMGLD